MKKETERIYKFIRDTVKEAGAKGVVLGLSGGLDSAVVYKLCVKALGEHGIYGCFMPVSNDITTASRLDSMVGVHNYHTVKLYNQFPGRIETDNKLVNGNIYARLRMIFLYAYANENNWLVVGTTNKSEYRIGYFTKHGDGACDFEPIRHLYKTDVYKLAKYIGVPQEIIDAKPTAGLWEGQTDEGEIGMSYEKLDAILEHFETYDSDCGYDIDDAGKNKGLDTYDMQKVYSMIFLSKHKRRLPKYLEDRK